MLGQVTVGRHENKIEAVVFVNAWILYPETSQAGLIGPAFDPLIGNFNFSIFLFEKKKQYLNSL